MRVRGTTKRGTFAALAVAVTLAVGACEGRQDETGEMTEAIEERQDADLSADSGVGEVEAYEGMTTLLESRNASGTSGTVAARRLDGTTRIQVALESADPSARYLAHLHRGTCDEPRGQVATLEPFVHTPDGATRSETTIETTRLDADTRYFVQVHGSQQAVIACGSLPDVSRTDGAE